MDSWAIVAFFMDEPAAQQIEDIIFEAQDKNISILITSVNLGEVWYSIARAHTDDIANLIGTSGISRIIHRRSGI
jgi:uncharacterized protein with PIN domain